MENLETFLSKITALLSFSNLGENHESTSASRSKLLKYASVDDAFSVAMTLHSPTRTRVIASWGTANKTINRINGCPNLIKEWRLHPRESRRHFFAELYRWALIYRRSDKIRRAARRELENSHLLDEHQTSAIPRFAGMDESFVAMGRNRYLSSNHVGLVHFVPLLHKDWLMPFP